MYVDTNIFKEKGESVSKTESDIRIQGIKFEYAGPKKPKIL